MKKNVSLIFFSLFIQGYFSCSSSDEQAVSPNQKVLIKAVDVSYISLIESERTVYKFNSVAQDPLETLKNSGCNSVRIRLWKNPTVNQSTFTEVKTLAIRAKQLGFKIWLSVHYSDTWANLANQIIPTEWQSLSFLDLKTAAVNYTSTILTEIQPDIIQIGNEINSGLLWTQGHLINNESQSLEWIAFRGNEYTNGSSWENQAL